MLSKFKIDLLVLLCFSIIIMSPGPVRASVIYVDPNAGPIRDGNSWPSAYETLQDALAVVTTGDEVRVASGIYRPDQGTGQIGLDMNSVFQLINGVAVKGGYAGYGADDPNERNTDLYVSILNGDLLQNDLMPTEPSDLLADPCRADNCYHVVSGSGTDSATVLDGFIITGGSARSAYPENQGGGMENILGSPTIINCIFKNNGAFYGAAIYNYDSSPNLTGCTFIDNYAGQSGGAMRNAYGSSPLIQSSSFKNNKAEIYGGAMSNFYNSSPKVKNSDFSGNSAQYGGCVNNYTDCSLNLINCVLNGNYVTIYGGSISNYDHSDSVLINCFITENWAYSGAGVYNFSSNPKLYNCILAGNRSAEYGCAIYNQFSNSDLEVINCTIVGNYSDTNGAALWNDSSSPFVSNSIFWDNININGMSQSAQVYTESGIPNINYCCIQNWTGGGIENISSDPLFIDANGPDGQFGTLDDNLRLDAASACIDSGNNTAVPNDIADLDNDANITERIPFDIDGNMRFVDYPGADNTGVPDVPDYPHIVDLGAHEHKFPLLVDSNAPGPIYNGTSWSKACKFLQDALSIATNGDEIWVAKGIYVPDANLSIPSGSGDREATFELIDGVSIYGGYGGVDANDPNLRDVNDYVSILSGDLLGNDSNLTNTYDLTTDSNRSDNCYHVVTSGSTGPSTLLDGFIITGGYADGTIGEANNLGGGIYGYNSSCIISSCIIQWNLSGYGGGVYSFGGQLSFNKCTFNNNWAYEVGGAMRNAMESKPITAECTFISNESQSHGGAIANSDASEPNLISCAFVGNKAQYGGAIHNYADSKTKILKCTFTNNQALSTGGAIRNYECNEITITDSSFSTNKATYGAAVYNFFSNPYVVNCNFVSNSAISGGGAICDSSSSSRISECVFDGNKSDEDGGALYNNDSNAIINNCIFRDNNGLHDGGAIYNTTSSSPEINNCLLVANSAYSGGAITNKGSSIPNLINCTLAQNNALGGGAVFNDGGNCSITNCILWDNHNSQQVYPSGSAVVNYSCVQNYSGPGIGNITADPCFINPTGDDGIIGTSDDDFRLESDSPCIDAADNNSVPINVTLALDNKDRITDSNCMSNEPKVDMGAYEFSYVYYGDFDGQCDVDFFDFAILSETWLTNYQDEGYNMICDIAPWPIDEKINEFDLKVLVDNWLTGR